jgi:hypothetical protein
MNLRRGCTRLAIGSAALWFVFWTFAYVIHPYTSLRPEPAFMVRITAWSVVVPCLVVAVLLGLWTAVGLRPKLEAPLARG